MSTARDRLAAKRQAEDIVARIIDDFGEIRDGAEAVIGAALLRVKAAATRAAERRDRMKRPGTLNDSTGRRLSTEFGDSMSALVRRRKKFRKILGHESSSKRNRGSQRTLSSAT